MTAMRVPPLAMSGRHGAAYGNYLDEFCGDPEISQYLGNVIGWHSYGCDRVPRVFLSQRRKLRDKLPEYPGWRFWH